MPNAIVANSVTFNRSAFQSIFTKQFNSNPHPWSSVTSRVYVADLHGRLWKFLASKPGQALIAADLGVNQPVATAVALQGQSNPSATEPTGANMIPNIFVTSGADRRAAGLIGGNPVFRNFSLLDGGGRR
jgi:hypothetical protein